MSLSGKQNNFNSSKIQDEKKIQHIVLEQKKTSKSVGLCVGSYDLLHPGHMKHFESAKKYCDKLIVGITSDYFVKKRKGPNRPIISEHLRAYSISQLKSVDYVLISPYEKAVDLIYQLKPSFYIKGSDYINKKTPGIMSERKAIAEVDGEMRYTHDEKFSTTELLSRIKQNSVKPVLILGGGMAGVGKSSILKKLAKKLNYVYMDKDDLNNSFLKTIDQGIILNKPKSESIYNSNVKYQSYLALLSLAKNNLENGLSVVLDGYFSNKLNLPFIDHYLKELSGQYYIIKIYFTAPKKVILERIKKRNLRRDQEKIKSIDSYFATHKKEDISDYDIVFDTSGDLSVNVDSLSHEIMNKIFGE